jgi:hypothetical protein
VSAPGAAPTPAQSPSATSILLAALTVAVFDGMFGITHCRLADSACTPAAFFRGIAGFAPTGFPGFRTPGLGILLHTAVATFWATTYGFTYRRWPALRRLTATLRGVAGVAVGVGAIVWLVMDLVVLPLVGNGRHTPVNSRSFWILLAGHPVFVGLPIAGLVRGRVRQ